MRRYQKFGFTLIELIITIVIVAILAGISVPIMSGAIENAKGINAAANLRVIGTSAGMFFNEVGVSDNIAYPDIASINANYLLDIHDPDFGYIGSLNNDAAYYFQATRQAGRYQGNYISINQTGSLNYDNWPFRH